MHACELIIARDPRIGKVPGARRTSGSRTKKAIRSFPDDTLAVLRASKGLRIRAGTGRHRFIGIWVVVVKDRVFVRSWSVKPNGWYRTFLKEPRGTIQVADYEIAVYAKCIKSERLRDAIDRAYLEKYNTAGGLRLPGTSAEQNPKPRLLSSCGCHRLIRPVSVQASTAVPVTSASLTIISKPRPSLPERRLWITTV